MNDVPLSDRIREVARLAAGNGADIPTANERLIINLCDDILKYQKTDWVNADSEKPDLYQPIVMFCENYLRNTYQAVGFLDDKGNWMITTPRYQALPPEEIRFWRYSANPFIPKRDE